MRNIWVVLAGVLLVGNLLNLNHNAFGNSSWEIIVHQGLRAGDNAQLTIDGVDLTKYGYTEIYQYVLMDSGTLFVLGNTTPEKSTLSVISPHEPASTIIMEYSWSLRGFLAKAKLTVFDFKQMTFVMLEYTDGNISRYSEETERYLEIFRANQNTYTMLRQEKIARTNIWHGGLPPESQYQYLELDDMSETPGPAKAELPTLFFSDVNDDGYVDILVWKRRYIAQKNEDRDQGSFRLDAEELHVMYFEPEEMTFSAITPLESQPWKHLGDVLFVFQ